MKIDITNLVPNFILGDKNGWALAKALEKMHDIAHGIIQEGIDTALNVDKMPEWRLDEVAREENVFWYDFNAPISAKREIIKNSGATYALLGTKTGAENAARDYCGDARIEEWFEYGGEPARFKIYTRNGDACETANEMIASVNSVKRLSSVLEGIYIDNLPLTSKVFAGTALYNGGKATFAMADANIEIEQSTWLTDEAENILTDERGMVLWI